MYSCVPDSALGEVAVEAVLEDAVALLARLCAYRRDEPVERRPGVEHERSAAARRWPRRRRDPTARAPPRGRRTRRARACRRGARRVDRDDCRAPPARARLRRRAAAAVVVLPTPPVPQQMTTCWRVDEVVQIARGLAGLSSAASRAICAVSTSASRPIAAGSISSVTYGRRICGSGSRRASRRDLLLLDRAARADEAGRLVERPRVVARRARDARERRVDERARPRRTSVPGGSCSRPPGRARCRPGPRARTRCRPPRSPASPRAASRGAPGSAPGR